LLLLVAQVAVLVTLVAAVQVAYVHRWLHQQVHL
jgi:hypothetical protein